VERKYRKGSLHYPSQFGEGTAEEQLAFGAIPVFLVGAVLSPASLPVGISEPGDFVMGGGGKNHGRELVGLATRAANMGSCAGMGHKIRTSSVITEVVGARYDGLTYQV
jgi:hypothetical protein